WIKEAYQREAEAAAAGEQEERRKGRGEGARRPAVDREASPLERLRELNPPVIRWFAARGVKLEEGEPVEVAPAIQHFQGGVKIRRRGETAVPGLFAAGEVAGGQHGANRPGGNALLDCQVFGRLAGEAAARWAAQGPPGPPRWAGGRIPVEEYPGRLAAELEAPEGLAAGRARARIQELCYRSAGVIRCAQGLEEGLRGLAELRRQGIRLDEEGPAGALEVRNLLLVAEAVLRSALTRRESRGPHLFFPDASPASLPLPRDEGWSHRYVVVRPPESAEELAALGEGMVVRAEKPVGWEEALSDLASF
ncbi:MAG: FAD-binding protein, partial [Bacillota bacterium]|nr:FAD-binding protein [Bacillota bacterium]